MRNRQSKCENCIWCDQCAATGINTEDCDDYSPSDDSGEFAYYDSILVENADEYRLMVEEYTDG